MAKTPQTCEHCRHWTPPPKFSEFGECKLAATSDGQLVHPQEEPRAIAGGSDWMTSLETHPDFGCNQFQEAARA